MESIGTDESAYNELINNYKDRQKHYSQLSMHMAKTISQIAWFRLLAFVLLIVAPILLFHLSTFLGVSSIVVFIFLFVVLINKFNKLKAQKNECEAIRDLNEDEINAYNNKWSDFNAGERFINTEHNYSYDLDLFGQTSFFQYINRTVTVEGENILAEHLSTEELDPKRIINKQNIFKELSTKIDFRQKFYGKGKVFKEKAEDNHATKDLKNYKNIFLDLSALFKSLVYVLPIILAITIIASFFYAQLVQLIIILGLLNLSVVGAYLKKVNKLHDSFSTLSKQLNKYVVLAVLIQDEDFKTAELQELQQSLYYDDKNAAEVINILAKDLSQLDQRAGILGGVLLNGLLLWDIKYILKIERWISKYHVSLDQWLQVIHKMDALNTMAGFVYNHPEFIYPELSKDNVFEVEEMGHPLLDRKKRVCNNYNFKESVFALVTGANMSGKSTFLRTVALNRVLAQSGMTVCAKHMVFKPMLLITNMRTADNLMKQESYFFAELKRLQFVINTLHGGEDVFVILDEILKGTNSKDKTYGSMELIKHLLRLDAYGMIATHDLELGILEKETKGKVNNICFEVENTDEQLKFDYKLYHGITQNHNATFLMKQMKIIN